MFRHVVLFNWTPEATEEQKERVAEELGRLPALIPSLREYHFGRNAGINPGGYEFAVVADCDDLDGYLAYRDNPEHRAIIDTFITPIVAQRAAIQYEF
jgi:Stress responsive A/B Barrel Domain